MTVEKVKVEYIGRKPFAFDNVAGSGKAWQGKGDVQEVTAAQAKTLTKYPDQWRLVNAADGVAVSAPVTIEVESAEGPVTVGEEDLSKPLERMSKPELAALAQSKWGKELSLSLSKKQAIDQIEEWMKELGE